MIDVEELCEQAAYQQFEDDDLNDKCAYSLGFLEPNYPVPAIRTMADNAQRLIAFGEISAENGFDIATVFERFVKL